MQNPVVIGIPKTIVNLTKQNWGSDQENMEIQQEKLAELDTKTTWKSDQQGWI